MAIIRHSELSGDELHGPRVKQLDIANFKQFDDVPIGHVPDPTSIRMIQILELREVTDAIAGAHIDPNSPIGFSYIDPNDPHTIKWDQSTYNSNSWGENMYSVLDFKPTSGKYYMEASATGTAPGASSIKVGLVDNSQYIMYEYWLYSYNWGTRLAVALDADNGIAKIFKDQTLLYTLNAGAGKQWRIEGVPAGTSNVGGPGSITFHTDPNDLLYTPPDGHRPGFGPGSNPRQRYVIADPNDYEVVIEDQNQVYVRRKASGAVAAKVNILI